MGRKKNVKAWKALTQKLNDFTVQAGWFENSKYDADTSVAMIAAIQNYGAHIKVTEKQRKYLHYLGMHLKNTTQEIVIPPRPFMDNAKKRIQGPEGQEMITQELLRVLEGKQTIEQAADRLGLWAKGIVQKEIVKITTPPLSEATIEIRNSKYASKSKNKASKPLNSSGFMVESVQYQVNKK